MADHRGATRGRAVLACAPGEHHDLGLLMLAVRMRADGWGIEYLGANVPVATTLELAESIGADLICFSASRPETFGELAAGLNSAAGHTPAVVVGGAGARTGDIKALGASRAPTKLDDAISQLRRIVP
jgi:methanogenic corrinoid protein MtbC1